MKLFYTFFFFFIAFSSYANNFLPWEVNWSKAASYRAQLTSMEETKKVAEVFDCAEKELKGLHEKNPEERFLSELKTDLVRFRIGKLKVSSDELSFIDCLDEASAVERAQAYVQNEEQRVDLADLFDQHVQKKESWKQKKEEVYAHLGSIYHNEPAPLWHSFFQSLLGLPFNPEFEGTKGSSSPFVGLSSNETLRQILWISAKELGFIRSEIEDPVVHGYKPGSYFQTALLATGKKDIIVGCGQYRHFGFFADNNIDLVGCAHCQEDHTKALTLNIDMSQMPDVLADGTSPDLWRQVSDGFLNNVVDETGHAVMLHEVFNPSGDLQSVNFNLFKVLAQKLKSGGVFSVVQAWQAIDKVREAEDQLKRIGFSTSYDDESGLLKFVRQ